MAIEVNEPFSPYEDDVKTVLDSLVVDRIKNVALDRWQDTGKEEDGDACSSQQQQQQPQMHANDSAGSNMTESGDSSCSSLNASMNSSGLWMNSSSRDSMDASMDMSSTSCNSAASRKMDRKKSKRLSKKKKKYSTILTSGNKSASTVTCENDLEAFSGQASLLGGHNSESSLCLTEKTAGEAQNEVVEPMAEREAGDSVVAPLLPRNSRSSSRRKRDANSKSIGLPRKCKSMDIDEKERFSARRGSLLKSEQSKLSKSALAQLIAGEYDNDHDKEEKGPPKRQTIKRGASEKKVLDGLAAISAHASTSARPKEIGRKIKLKRAVSDLGKFSDGILESSFSATEIASSPAKSGKLRNIKQAFANLGKSQSRLMEENKSGKSPVPVRMPSRRNIGSKRLPTTSVGSNSAAIIIPRATKSFSERRAEKAVKVDPLSKSVHGTSSTCTTNRRARAAQLSQGYTSERNLAADKDDSRHSTCGTCRREMSSTGGINDERPGSAWGTRCTGAGHNPESKTAAASAPFNWKNYAASQQ